MYGSRRITCRNAWVTKVTLVRQSKICSYEIPYSVKGTIKLTGSKEDT